MAKAQKDSKSKGMSEMDLRKAQQKLKQRKMIRHHYYVDGKQKVSWEQL